MPWRWLRSQPTTLPGLVSRQAGRIFPGLPFSTDELRRLAPDDRIREVTRAIYGILKDRRIAYERNQVIIPGPSPAQLVRTPWEIRADRRGTCLDLSLLFCGVCATYELLPVLLLFEDHALAAVCNTHDLHDPQQERRSLYAGLAKHDPAELFRDRGRLLEAVRREAYLAVECTGFAVDDSLPAPDGHAREGGQLSFDAALAAGREQLERGDRRGFCAVDVTIGWNVWGVAQAPNLPEGPYPPVFQEPPRQQAGIGGDVEFVGREAELRELLAFLEPRPESGNDFRWALWTAPGGQGKTRLAWRFCREARRLGWSAGFLGAERFEDWAGWDVSWPTLLVVDQVAHRPDSAREAILALSRTPGRIVAPLRLLLLERPFQATDTWVEAFGRPELDDSPYLFEHSHVAGASLDEVAQALRPLERPDLWRIMTAILDRLGKPHPDREATLDRLMGLDPAGRPLFAILAAEAIAEHGSDQWRRWDRQTLVKHILKRDFNAWKRLLVGEARPGDPAHALFEDHLNALTLATVAGRRSSESLERLRGEFGIRSPARLLPDWVRTMTAYGVDDEDAPGGESMPGLAPDILGELFVLERLAGEFGADTNRRVPREQTRRILDVGLVADRYATVDFLVRTIRDFGDHPSVSAFGEIDIPEGDDANFGLLIDHAVQVSRILERVDRPDLAERLFTGLVDRARRLLLDPRHNVFRDELDALLARGLYNRGHSRVDREDLAGTRADLDESVAILDALLQRPHSRGVTHWQNLDLWANALRARAYLFARVGDLSAAFQDLERLLAHAELSQVERAEGLLLRGQIREKTRALGDAASDYEEILRLGGPGLDELRGLARERLVPVLHFWSYQLRSGGDYDSAHECLGRMIALTEGDPESRAKALVDRGALVIQALTQINRSGQVLTGHRWELSQAMEDFDAVVESPDAPEEQKRKARSNRSQLFFERRDFPAALRDVDALLQTSTPPDRIWATSLLTRAQICRFGDRTPEALEDLRSVVRRIDIDQDVKWMAEALLEKMREERPG